MNEVTLGPKDQIVITPAKKISLERADAMKKLVEERFPGHVVTVLNGVEMTVVREVAA